MSPAETSTLRFTLQRTYAYACPVRSHMRAREALYITTILCICAPACDISTPGATFPTGERWYITTKLSNMARVRRVFPVLNEHRCGVKPTPGMETLVSFSVAFPFPFLRPFPQSPPWPCCAKSVPAPAMAGCIAPAGWAGGICWADDELGWAELAWKSVGGG